jgi:hypothetical protein
MIFKFMKGFLSVPLIGRIRTTVRGMLAFTPHIRSWTGIV